MGLEENNQEYRADISLAEMNELKRNRVPLCYNLSKVNLISSGIPHFYKMKTQLIYILIILLFPAICEITLNRSQP